MTSSVVNWTINKVPRHQLTIILAVVVGILASFAAYILHWIISQIQLLLTAGFNRETSNLLYLLFPVIGIFLTMLFVKYIVKDNISHGITRVLYAISTKQSRLKPHNMWSSVIASAITIGFGGSVGAEAPIVLTGSAIGSNLGQLFNLDRKSLMLLLGCGASAAISGIFKAPIAGLVFTLEVLMIDLSMASLVPILTSSVTATVLTYILSGQRSMFDFQLDSAWQVDRVPATILFGVFCGFLSLYFIRMMTACEGVFAQLSKYPYTKLLLGGLVLSTLIFLFPSLYGEGYNSISILLNGKTDADWDVVMERSLFASHGGLLLVYITGVLLTKIVATSSTNGAGGCGGTFAPSLFVGAFGGFLFSRLWNIYQVGVYIPEKNFTLLGMAGVMAGVMHAPLTGIFLIAEITGGYQLFVPLLIVAVVSVMTISIFEPHSIYAMRLAREGKLVTHHTDQSVLTLMSLDSVVERDFVTVKPSTPMGKMVNILSQTPTSFLLVTDDGGHLLGEVDLLKIRNVVFRTELYQKFTVVQLMTDVKATLGKDDPMSDVMKTFETTGADYLPVVDFDNKLVGYVSRVHLYGMYRKLVADYSAE